MAVLLSGSLAIVSACGSDGNSAPTIEDVDEGSGASVNLSTPSNAESIVKTILNNSSNAFDSAESSSSSSSSTGSSGSSSSTTIKSLVKSSSGDAKLDQFCSTGHYEEAINKTIKGYSGTAVFIGNTISDKTSEDQATTSINVDGNFTNFVYYTPAKGKSYKLTGTAHMDGEANITKGLKQLCSLALSDAEFDETTNVSISSDIYEHTTGAFTVSGDIGAAIVFDLTTTMAISNDSNSESYDISISGTASLKSGGKTVECVIGKTGDMEYSSLTVDCK